MVTGASRPRPSARPELIESIHNGGVRGAHFEALLSRFYGGLVSYRFGATPETGRDLLRAIPQPNFWHVPTSNERGWGMPFRDGPWLLASRYAVASEQSPEVVVHVDSIEVSYTYVLPTTPAGECVVTYRVAPKGTSRSARCCAPATVCRTCRSSACCSPRRRPLAADLVRRGPP